MMTTPPSDCTRCPELVKSRCQVTSGAGDPNADLFLIGEAPGPKEDTAGEPFVGSTGDRLMGLLADVGLSRNEVYLTNTVKCFPEDTRDPTETEKANCFEYLLAEIEAVEPTVLVPMGQHARSVVFDDDPWSPLDMTDSPWFEASVDGVTYQVVPTVHPTATFFNAKWHVWMREALETAHNHVKQ